MEVEAGLKNTATTGGLCACRQKRTTLIRIRSDMPTIKIDFFQVYQEPRDGGEPIDLHDVFLKLKKRTPAKRTIPTADGWIHLLEVNEHSKCISGVFLKAKSDQIPPIASKSGALEDLLLRADQGIA